MNGKTNHGGIGMGCMKTLAMLALVAGAGLWSGCDQADEMSAMARKLVPGIGSFSADSADYLPDHSIERSIKSDDGWALSPKERRRVSDLVLPFSEFDKVIRPPVRPALDPSSDLFK